MKNYLINEESASSIPSLLLGIWFCLSRRRKAQLLMLLPVMLTSAAAELLSLGAVLPFLGVLSDPGRFWQQPLVRAISMRVGITNASHLLVPTTLIFALAALLAALIRLANLWVNSQVAAAVGSDLSSEAFLRTLYQPYSVHVQRNSAAVIACTTHIGNTVGAIRSLLQLSTSAVVAAALLAGLLLINWWVALGAAALFGSIYGLLALMSNRRLRRNSLMITSATRLQIQVLHEGLGAIRDVLLDSNQRTYVEIYRQADSTQRQLQARNFFVSAFPRYVVEALGLLAIALLGLLMVHRQGSGSAVIPLLGALALGSQRLLPALQQVYVGWSTIKGCSGDISALLVMLRQPMPHQTLPAEPLPLQESLRMESVYFRYGPDQPDVLRGLNLEIHPGERIGIIGSTGSGKSTMADLLMGLLAPSSGRVMVDGEDLHDPFNPARLAAWRAAIAHVPQSIYLADSSFAENIAFGMPRHKIDMYRVKQAAEQSQISSLIESSAEGYQSYVGERGIRLSGGQRQRIGIARALYKRSQVLVLDEATSALDNCTEDAVMTAVEELSRELTIVIIAHRFRTVERCDRVILLSRGVVSADGEPTSVINQFK